MAKQSTATRLVTPVCRLAFPALFTPRPTVRGGTDEKYQATILIPPDVSLDPFRAAMKAAAIAEFGDLDGISREKLPIKTCASKTNLAGYEEGWHFINTKSQFQPDVVDQKVDPIIQQDLIYAGCWCRFSIHAYAWSHPTGGKGVSFGLDAVQLIREGDRLDGRRDAKEVFDAVAFDEVETTGEAAAEDIWG